MAPEDLEPLLLPRPKKLKLLGGRTATDDVRYGRHTGGAPESYELKINDRIEICAGDDAGQRHGHRMLDQLRVQYAEDLPRLHIEDSPSFQTRGCMLDVSRCRVPTNDELLQVVESFAAIKLNHIQLYTERTFAYPGREAVWKNASPVTPDDVSTLQKQCNSSGIELAANQNCFGHLTAWLEHPKYAHLAETTGNWDFFGVPRSGPFSLCPTDPRSIEFVRGLLDELLPCFDSELVNIGCDETADVGQGRSRDTVAERGSAVYAEFVSKVAEHVRSLGKRPMFWADIALRRPEALDMLPNDIIALAWGYEPDSPFDDWLTTLSAHRFESWVCPGTSSWRSITGRTTERRANIINAARAGVEHGATGFLLTDWGDLGHRQQWPIALNAIAQAADAAWTGGATEVDTRAVSLHVLGDHSLRIADWLDELGDVDRELRQITGIPKDGKPTRLKNASALFEDMHAARPRTDTPGTADQFRNVRERLDALADTMPTGFDDLMEDELRHAVVVAQYAADRAIARRAGDDPPPDSRITGIINEHRRLWKQRSRPGGLDESCRYYEELKNG